MKYEKEVKRHILLDVMQDMALLDKKLDHLKSFLDYILPEDEINNYDNYYEEAIEILNNLKKKTTKQYI